MKKANKQLTELVLAEFAKGGVNVKKVDRNKITSGFVGNRLTKLQIKYPHKNDQLKL